VLRVTENHKFACPQCRKVRDPTPPTSYGRKIHIPTESIQSFLHSDPVSESSDSESSESSESQEEEEEEVSGPRSIMSYFQSTTSSLQQNPDSSSRPHEENSPNEGDFSEEDEEEGNPSSEEEEESDPDELGSMEESDDERSRKRALEIREVSSSLPRVLFTVSGNSHLEILGTCIKYKTGDAVARLFTDWYTFFGEHEENAESHLLGIGKAIIGTIDVQGDGVVEILSKELLSAYLDIRVSGNGKVKFGECGTLNDVKLETADHGIITVLESISSIWVHKLTIFQHGAGSIGMFRALDELNVTNSGTGRVSVFQCYDCELGRNVNVGAGGVNEIIRC